MGLKCMVKCTFQRIFVLFLIFQCCSSSFVFCSFCKEGRFLKLLLLEKFKEDVEKSVISTTLS